MEELSPLHISWLSFIVASIVLVVALQLFSYSVRNLHNFLIWGRFRIPASDISKKAIILLEPLVIVIITGLFIAIHPLYHGLGIVLLSALTYLQIRDYLSGRVIYFTSNIIHDKKISVGDKRGSVVKLGRLGLHISNSEGVMYLNHYRILSEGFILAAGQQQGEYCQLIITSGTANGKQSDIARKINELLVTLPYLNWKFKPKLKVVGSDPPAIEVKLLLHQKVSQNELIRFFTEAGYNCTEKTN